MLGTGLPRATLPEGRAGKAPIPGRWPWPGSFCSCAHIKLHWEVERRRKALTPRLSPQQPHTCSRTQAPASRGGAGSEVELAQG